jgi:transglutaminase-like putative cysteine protease
VRIAFGQESIVKSERFDALARLIAQVGDRQESRRSVLRAAIVGGLAVASGPATGVAAPASRLATRSRNQDAGIDPLIAELAFQLEYDRDRIIAFVQDEIGYEPYAGALRGPVGTLWSAAGNSVDKAQLLAALLDASSIRARLVIGTAKAEDLTAAYRQGLAQPVSEALTGAFGYLINPSGTTPATPAATLPDTARAKVEAFREALLGEATSRIATHSEQIAAALTDAGVALAGNDLVIPDPEIDQHVRVQVAKGTEWIDVDLTGGKSADQGAAPQVLDAIPDEWFHTITMRITHEEVRGDASEAVQSLEHVFRSQDLATADLALTHLTGADKNTFGLDLGGLLGGTESYYATLVAGDELISSDVPMVFGGQGGVLDALGEAANGVSDGEPIAEMLEIEIASPGSEPIIVRRPIFDRLGQHRADPQVDLSTLEPVNQAQLGNGEKAYIPLSVMHSFAVVTGAVPAGYSVLPKTGESVLTAFSAAARGTQATRQAIVRHGKGIGQAGFVNRPSLVRYVYAPALERTGEQDSLRISADILADSRSGEGGGKGAPFGIVAGVTSQIAEETALDPRLFDVLTDIGIQGHRPSEYGSSVGAIIEQASKAGIPLTVLDTADALAAYPGDLQPIARALVAAHIDGGSVVVLPVRMDPEAAGWWVYNPLTGTLFDQLADGTGGAMLLAPMSEYALKLATWVQVRAPYLLLAECIAALASAANDYLGGDKWGAVANAIEKFGACK